MERIAALIGIATMVGGCWYFSSDRARIRWRIVVVGIALQVFLALFLVRPDIVPWLLSIACGASLGLLAKPREEEVSYQVTRSLGMLGFLTTLIALWLAADSVWQRSLVVLAGALVYGRTGSTQT
ncbi:MAG: Na+ dependent nucleoside transporter N-terminal domain-containing protein, partial [Planctomycetota bacterium]